MEHEMRLAVLPYDGDGDTHPMIMPYCVGCGWVSERRYPFTAESVPAEWRTHVKEFNESEDRRIAAWLEHQRARRDAVDLLLEARAGDEGA